MKSKHPREMLTVKNIEEKFSQRKVKKSEILAALLKEQMKEEDAALAIITSAFALDALVTLNRKHLQSKKEVINQVLKKNGLGPILVVSPDEI